MCCSASRNPSGTCCRAIERVIFCYQQSIALQLHWRRSFQGSSTILLFQFRKAVLLNPSAAENFGFITDETSLGLRPQPSSELLRHVPSSVAFASLGYLLLINLRKLFNECEALHLFSDPPRKKGGSRAAGTAVGSLNDQLSFSFGSRRSYFFLPVFQKTSSLLS